MDGHLKGGYNWEGTRGRGVLVWRALKEMPFNTFLVIDDKIFWHLGGLEGITKKGQGEGGVLVWRALKLQIWRKCRLTHFSWSETTGRGSKLSSNWANAGDLFLKLSQSWGGRLEKSSFQDFGLCSTMRVVNSTNKSWHGSDLPVFATSNVNWLKPLNKANVSPMLVIF